MLMHISFSFLLSLQDYIIMNLMWKHSEKVIVNIQGWGLAMKCGWCFRKIGYCHTLSNDSNAPDLLKYVWKWSVASTWMHMKHKTTNKLQLSVIHWALKRSCLFLGHLPTSGAHCMGWDATTTSLDEVRRLEIRKPHP